VKSSTASTLRKSVVSRYVSTAAAKSASLDSLMVRIIASMGSYSEDTAAVSCVCGSKSGA